jgi:MSHA biogenesis protein MshL
MFLRYVVAIRNTISTGLLTLILISCSGKEYHTNQYIYHDSNLKLQEHELIEKLYNSKAKDIAKKYSNRKMKLSEVIYMPDEPSSNIDEKLISVNVTEEVPVIDLIMEIARMADVDVQVDPTITGGLILNVKDKPLNVIFNRIAGMTNTRYRQKAGVYIFENDIPYTKSYYVDFLDFQRSSSGSMSLQASVVSEKGASSSASVSTSSDDKFWEDILDNIKLLIKITQGTYSYYTKAAIKAQKKQQESKVNSDTQTSGDGKDFSESSKSDSNNDTVDTSSSEEDAIKINKKAGIITITASEKSHRRINEYLEELKIKANTQVLIEMKFIEITLSKKYEAGVDWRNVDIGNTFKIASKGLLPSSAAIEIAAGGSKSTSLASAVSLFEQFGSTRVLLSPRINAFNNQLALMTVSENKIYFETQTSITYPQGNTVATNIQRNVSATPKQIPIGVVMSVLPAIDLSSRTVTLNMKPTISTLGEYVSDPSVEIASTGVDSSTTSTSSSTSDSQTSKVKSMIPQTNTRELDTIMRLEDGQMAIIGGFTQRRKSVTEKGIPILRAIPLLGNLFKNKIEETNVIETLILVKATIVDGNGMKMDSYEKSIYHDLAEDPRDYGDD